MSPRRLPSALIASAICLVAFAPLALGLPPLSTFELPGRRGPWACVHALCPTGDGRLWVGSDRLFLFGGETFTPVPLPAEQPDPGHRLGFAGASPGSWARASSAGWRKTRFKANGTCIPWPGSSKPAGVSILEESWRLGAYRRTA